MWTDALGETHFEIWNGIQLDGRCFKSVPLYNVCSEFGDAQVKQACIDLGCRPYVQDLGAIREECQRQEDSYV
jgi:hypothetical protein